MLLLMSKSNATWADLIRTWGTFVILPVTGSGATDTAPWISFLGRWRSGGPAEESGFILSEPRCAQNFSLLHTRLCRKLMFVAHHSSLIAPPGSSAAPAVESGCPPHWCRLPLQAVTH
jgi:hypothetical protein